MYLEEIVENIKLENDKFEAKSILNREDVVGWLKSIAGFANASGGEFYIGVEDKSNKLIGFDRKNADNERNYFNNQVNEHAAHLGISDSTYLRKKILGNLEEKGYLEKSKVSRATYYKTNPDMVTVD